MPEKQRKEPHTMPREHVSPKRAAEQDAPEPERPSRPDEEQGQSIGELEEPPQAEGPRD